MIRSMIPLLKIAGLILLAFTVLGGFGYWPAFFGWLMIAFVLLQSRSRQ